jgi:hypothetical protein
MGFQDWLRWALLVLSPRSFGSAGANNVKGGFTMRMIWLCAVVLMSSTISVYAGTPVPEIDGVSGLAAMGVVGSIVALIWERRRKRRS